MTENDKELMNRYIYQVVRRLPKSQREETAMELKELIEDMAEQDGQTVENVIGKLGNPAAFARQYQDRGSYLIGPKYYEDYIWVLKIVMLCVVASVVVSSIVQGFMQPEWIKGIVEYITENGFSSLLFGFGSVTLVFAILERQNIKVDLRDEKKWTVDDLKGEAPPKSRWTPKTMGTAPNKKSLISRGESTVGVVFTAVFCGIILFAPHLLGAYVFEDKEFVRTIPLLNLDAWGRIAPVLVLALAIGFIDEVIRLVTGCYCKAVMASNIICNTLQLGLWIFAVRFLPFWNPDFIPEIAEEFGRHVTSKGDIFFYYGTDSFSYLMIGIITLITVLETGETIYRTIRYGTDI